MEPGSGKHSVYTHFPKKPNCDICLKTKITSASCRRRAGTVVPRAEHFGDLITADHKVLSDESEFRNNHRYAVVVQDLATQWLQSHLCRSKSSQETQKNLMKFLEPTRKQKSFTLASPRKLASLAEELSWNHCTSTPHRSETNGIAERAVRRVKEGTSVVLLQSGLGNERWADSMECYCHLRNIQDLLSDGKTPYERRFGMPFNGPVIPFGALVEYHPVSAKDQSRLHQFGAKVLPGIFRGNALHVEGIWKGDIVVADIEELEQMDAPQRSGNFTFLVADGTVKIFGGEQRLRTSTLTPERPERGEEQVILQGMSDELDSPTQLQDDSTWGDEEAEDDFWTITGEFICRHLVVPRVELYVPREESSPVPLKYIDVSRITHTKLG